MLNGIQKNYYSNLKNVISQEIYYENGMIHREDGPAVINYNCDGKIRSVSYFINNKCHREDGPAQIEFNVNGDNKKIEFYCLNGEYIKNGIFKKIYCDQHIEAEFFLLDDGCFQQYYYGNSNSVVCIYYYDNLGKLHNENGAAVEKIWSVNSLEKQFYIHGKRIYLNESITESKIRRTKKFESLNILKLSLNYLKPDNYEYLIDLIDSKLLMMKLI